MPVLMFAAGFLEPSDMPWTVAFTLVTYIALIALPFALFYRWRLEKTRRRNAMLSGVAVAILAPFVIRFVAIIVRGSYWADWHLIWLYLLFSPGVVTCYLLAVGIWL